MSLISNLQNFIKVIKCLNIIKGLNNQFSRCLKDFKLNDVITKVLRKVAIQPEGKEEELDDTLLT